VTDEHRALQFTISSPGWMLYLKRGGERQKEYMSRLLDQNNVEMSSNESNYLRGYVNALIWSATWVRQEVDEALAEEMAQCRMASEGNAYEQIEELGHTFGDRLTEEEISA
jgi:hypothetical protein